MKFLNIILTENQFKRVLDQHFHVLLSQEEEDSLFAKYNLKGDQINYREFCNTINKFVPENDLSVDPKKVAFKNPEFLQFSSFLMFFIHFVCGS